MKNWMVCFIIFSLIVLINMAHSIYDEVKKTNKFLEEIHQSMTVEETEWIDDIPLTKA